MNQNVKRGVMRVLCGLLVIPTLMGVFPQAKLETQAASAGFNCSDLGYGGGPPEEIRITMKTKDFNIGDYITVFSPSAKYTRLSFNSGVTYKSSNPKVASINSSGLITPKKKGRTKLTLKYKGASWKVDLAVVSKVEGDFSKYKELQKTAKTLSKECGKKITASNRYKVFNADVGYRKVRKKESDLASSAIRFNGLYSTYDGKLIANIVVPVLGRGNAISWAVLDYIREKNPIGYVPEKTFKSVGISGKGSSVTVKLSKKVTEDQIFGIKAGVSYNGMKKIKKSNKAEFPVKIKDIKTGKEYSAIATATKGKNTLEIKLAKNAKLKKNRSYRLMGVDKGSINSTWTKQGKTKFKAK